ncbi:MAG TPA: hypothetical protein VNA87_05500 [Actinomycetota bacterium]|nr:hypothetical protein [Actinomycetota bacterium]
MRSYSYPRVKQLASTDAGIFLALFWGVAEALFFRILPDFYLVAAVPAAPRRWWRLATAASIGSVVGGVIGYWLSFPRRSSFPLEYMPLITEKMIHTAGSWLASDGALAILRQPMSGIPYKVFVYLSGAGHTSFLVFLWASCIARATRIFVVTGIAGGVGALAGENPRSRWYDVFLIAFVILFSLSLKAVVESFR